MPYNLIPMGYRVIAIDLDDVIINSSPIVAAYYNKRYGTNVGLKDMYSENLKAWGVSDGNVSIARVEKFLATEEFLNIPPSHEAISTIMMLSKKYELHIVTGRSFLIESETRKHIEHYFPKIFKSVEFTNLYTHKKRNKADVCMAIGAGLLIEDHLGHAVPVAEAGIDVLLFGDYPWNQTINLPRNMKRVLNWKEITERLL